MKISHLLNPGEWVERHSQLRGSKIAVRDIDTGNNLTYKELNNRSNALGNKFLDLGLKKGERIGLLLKNRVEFIEIYFACAKTGVTFVPFNIRLSHHEIINQIIHCQPKILFIGSETASLAQKVKEQREKLISNLTIYFLDDSHKKEPIEAAGKDMFCNYSELFEEVNYSYPRPPWEILQEDVQLILYTAGTTGQPKGCMLPYRKTIYNTLNDQHAYGLTERDVFLCTLPLFYSGGLNIITIPTIYVGGEVVLLWGIKGDPERILGNIEKYRVTAFLGVAYHAKLINNYPNANEKYGLKSLRYWSFGGEPIPFNVIRDLQRKWPHVAVASSYGTTETSLAATFTPTRENIEKIKFARKIGKFPVGKQMFYSPIKIVNEKGEEVGSFEPGEILIGGPTLFKGYWKDPEKTREAIDKEGYFHTGDIAMKDEEGNIYVVDRKSNIIKSGGEKIYAAEIEEIILQHPKVADVAVIGIEDKKWGERPIAFLVPKKQASLKVEEVVRLCREKLAKFKVPDKVIIMSELPRTSSGKTVKWKLKELYKETLCSGSR